MLNLSLFVCHTLSLKLCEALTGRCLCVLTLMIINLSSPMIYHLCVCVCVCASAWTMVLMSICCTPLLTHTLHSIIP